MILTATKAGHSHEMDVELVETVLDEDIEKQKKSPANEGKKLDKVRKNLKTSRFLMNVLCFMLNCFNCNT